MMLYLTEYAEVHIGGAGRVGQIPTEPPLAEQKIDFSGGVAQSALFSAQTRLIRMHTDAPCSVLFGTNPTATILTGRLAGSQTEFRAVPVGGTFRVSVISNP